MAGRFPEVLEVIKKKDNELGDQMMKPLLNSVIAKYRDSSVSCFSRFVSVLRFEIRQCLAYSPLTNHDILR